MLSIAYYRLSGPHSTAAAAAVYTGPITCLLAYRHARTHTTHACTSSFASFFRLVTTPMQPVALVALVLFVCLSVCRPFLRSAPRLFHTTRTHIYVVLNVEIKLFFLFNG